MKCIYPSTQDSNWCLNFDFASDLPSFLENLKRWKKSIYKGLRRPRWSQFASEIYKVDTIVYGTYNVGTWSFHIFVLFQLLQIQFRYRLKIPKQPEQDSGCTSKRKIFAPSWKWPLSSHNSVTVNSVGVNTKNRRKKTGKNATRFCWCLHDACKTNFYSAVCHID